MKEGTRTATACIPFAPKLLTHSALTLLFPDLHPLELLLIVSCFHSWTVNKLGKEGRVNSDSIPNLYQSPEPKPLWPANLNTLWITWLQPLSPWTYFFFHSTSQEEKKKKNQNHIYLPRKREIRDSCSTGTGTPLSISWTVSFSHIPWPEPIYLIHSFNQSWTVSFSHIPWPEPIYLIHSFNQSWTVTFDSMTWPPFPLQSSKRLHWVKKKEQWMKEDSVFERRETENESELLNLLEGVYSTVKESRRSEGSLGDWVIDHESERKAKRKESWGLTDS